MSRNKITSSQGLHSGPSKREISIGFVGEFAGCYLREGPRWWGLKPVSLPLTADVIVYAHGTHPSFDTLDNRGTPVIVIDESDSPSISVELLHLLQRPEVSLCFRRYGFRDAQAYFRCDDYYTEVYRQASKYASPPDHFPLHDDDPLGNAIRKIRVSLPVFTSLPVPSARMHVPLSNSTWRERASSPFIDRSTDVLFVEEPNNPQVELLRNMWADLPGRKEWIAEFSSYEELRYPIFQRTTGCNLPIFSDTIVFISGGLPSPLDLFAVLSGCIVIKPECSNVYSAQDIYDPIRGCIQYCDATLTELPSIVSYIFDNLDEYEERTKKNLEFFDMDADEGAWASEFRSACVSVAEGSYRLGDVVSALPLGK